MPLIVHYAPRFRSRRLRPYRQATRQSAETLAVGNLLRGQAAADQTFERVFRIQGGRAEGRQGGFRAPSCRSQILSEPVGRCAKARPNGLLAGTAARQRYLGVSVSPCGEDSRTKSSNTRAISICR